MTKPIWKTERDLGTLVDSSYFEKQLQATSTAGAVQYQLISGKLPKGLELKSNGKLSGVPNIRNTNIGDLNQTVQFTIRASNLSDKIADRTFNLLISGVQAPVIETSDINLGIHYDGDFFAYQLKGSDEHLGSNLSWRFVRGRLPPGITLNSQGLMSGFFAQTIVDPKSFQRIGWDKLGWDKFVYDFIRTQNDKEYEFTVELSDGLNFSRQNYRLKIIAKDLLTADRTFRFGSERIVTADRTKVHKPFITTMPQILPEIKFEKARQDTYFAFKFDAVDFDLDEIEYHISSPDELGFDQDGDVINHNHGIGFDMDEFDSSEYPMPMYIGLNNQTGWYTGQIKEQVIHSKDFEFDIYCRKKRDWFIEGYRSRFKVRVLGQVEEKITWITESDLGTIKNGNISGLRLQAHSSTGKNIVYRLKSDTLSRTPQGIILLRDGMLSGRCSFLYYKNDNGTTTYDGGKTSFDTTYVFTVIAENQDGSAYAEKTFTLKVANVNLRPYENLYLRGFPTREQRLLFTSIMNNQDLFPDQLIFRLNDPWYGKASDIRFLFLAGISAADLPTYIEAMSRNHFVKTITFGDIKTAVALDSNFNTAYEVVYLDVLDDLEGKDPITGEAAGPAQTVDLSFNKNFFISKGQSYTELTPNALKNMGRRIEESIGVDNKNSLPLWMTSPQPDPNRQGKFLPALGYTRAVILAYTVPGASKLIAYRLKNANFSFNSIPFKTDRYQLDNYLSQYYDLDIEQFIPGEETTFDETSSIAQRYRFAGSVDYAVTIPYEKLHSQNVEYINYWGGLDGVTDFQDGDTVIFAQQENFQSDPLNLYVNFDVYGNRPGPSQDRRTWPVKYRNVPDPYVPFGGHRFDSDFDTDGFDHGRIGFQRWVNNEGQRLPYNRWLYWTDGWMHQLPFDQDIYSQLPFSQTSMIPGFIDKILLGKTNERAGVYRINIDTNNYVTLTLLRNTKPGDIVSVNQGMRFGGKQLYFEQYVRHGNVPRWWLFNKTLTVDHTSQDFVDRKHTETTFDNKGTRFISYRDQYAEPETDAKYIKFPKYGVFI